MPCESGRLEHQAHPETQTEAPQPVHFDAAERCLYTAFVALQDVTYEMGPTHFWPGFVCCFAMDS